MAEACLCIDVGGSSIKYAMIDSELSLSEYGKVSTPYEDIEAYLSCLTDIYLKFEGRVKGISLSVPGIIDSANGICINAGNLHYADGLHLVRELEERCHVQVAIMNDAKSAALAESTWGALADCKNSVVIVLGTGIGGAFIKDGEVYMGSHFAAGEFSYININKDVDFPNSMLWEEGGNQRLLSMAACARGLDSSDVSGEDVFRWIEEGDASVIPVLNQFTRTIARLIINLQFILDPDRFAIGGGISRQPKLLEFINKNLEYYYSNYPSSIQKAEVVTCKYFNEANLIGAYSNFLKTFN